jgi:1,4-dihydroxy-2-naphthoyl-CoA synthase
MTGVAWEPAGKFEDIKYHKAEGIAKITIKKPRRAATPIRRSANPTSLSSPAARNP